MAVTMKVVFAEEPKWTMVIAKNVRQVINQVVETLADAPKHEECKFNLCLIGFEAKEGETKKELVQRLNIELLQGQMRLRAKVIVATWQRPATMRAFGVIVGTHFDLVLLKFVTSEDRQAVLRGCKGLVGTKLGLDKDFTPAQ